MAWSCVPDAGKVMPTHGEVDGEQTEAVPRYRLPRELKPGPPLRRGGAPRTGIAYNVALYHRSEVIA